MVKVPQGREIQIRRAHGNVAFCEFDDLCDKPMGTSDFIAVARNFHVLILRDIPVLSFENRNLVRRFILLVLILKCLKFDVFNNFSKRLMNFIIIKSNYTVVQEEI